MFSNMMLFTLFMIMTEKEVKAALFIGRFAKLKNNESKPVETSRPQFSCSKYILIL